MCGRFAQSQTREDYLALLAEDIERDIPFDPEPIGRYNVAPGTKVWGGDQFWAEFVQPGRTCKPCVARGVVI